MKPIRLQAFQGAVPRRTRRQLGDIQAQAISNFRMTSGRLDPLYSPKSLQATVPAGDLKSLYRLYDSAGASYWLAWLDDTDVVRGPVAGDSSFRFYYSSEAFEPRASNLAMATSAAAPYPNTWFVLGVFAPTTKPTAAPTGGSGTLETRTYCYTFVTPWGEESAPSPAATLVSGYPNATWAITCPDVAPANTYTVTAVAWVGGVLTFTVTSTFGLRAGERVTPAGLAPAVLNTSMKVLAVTDATHFTVAMAANPGTITDGAGTVTRDAPHNTAGMTKRLYRSVTTAADTQFYFAKEVAVATTAITDDVGAAIGEPLPTTGWAMPPTDLQGMKMLPCGSIVGFRGNEICFSEPLSPCAWPTSYRITTDYPLVGLGVFGTSFVACTTGTPYLITGLAPESMSPTKVDQQWPCLSKRSIVEMGYGTTWATAFGLAHIGLDGTDLITEAFYTEREWRAINPASLISAYYSGRYYGAYQVDSQTYGILVLDGKNAEAVVSFAQLKPTALWTDPATGRLYLAMDGDIKEWDADQSTRLSGAWWSKEFVAATPFNMGAARVEGEFFGTATEEAAYAALVEAQHDANDLVIAVTTAGAGSINGSGCNAYGFNDSEVVPDSLVGDGALRAVTFELYASGELVFSKTVSRDATFRLPAGKKYDNFSVRLIGNVPIDAVVIGETAVALAEA